MKLNAYVLAADPAFLAASVGAYYSAVDRIIVSYDADGLSWAGHELPVETCLSILRAIDVDNKCVFSSGHYVRTDLHPLEADTAQRQAALDEASEGSDWVLQFDTDEYLPDARRFLDAIEAAERAGASALEYPARWLYSSVGGSRFLEASSRFGRTIAGYPGPLAIRAGSRLTRARQSDVPLYRLDIRPWNTDPYHPRDAIVHEVVRPDQAVVHYSWVRTPETMRRKFGWSGHAETYEDPKLYRQWMWRTGHPRLTSLTSPLRRRDHYRVSRLVEMDGIY